MVLHMAINQKHSRIVIGKPSKFFLMKDARPNVENVLSLSFANDELNVMLFTNQRLNLPWYRRLWHALLYVLGIEVLLARNTNGTSFIVNEADYNKVLTISTMAYLRQIQKKNLHNEKR
jgi:hypothetical protein